MWITAWRSAKASATIPEDGKRKDHDDLAHPTRHLAAAANLTLRSGAMLPDTLLSWKRPTAHCRRRKRQRHRLSDQLMALVTRTWSG